MIDYLNKRKLAFTLAEVLITLGIIGVVAAITLPTMIAIAIIVGSVIAATTPIMPRVIKTSARVNANFLLFK